MYASLVAEIRSGSKLHQDWTENLVGENTYRGSKMRARTKAHRITNGAIFLMA